MALRAEEVKMYRDYFAEKLRAEKQRNDVLKAVNGEISYDFVLLDTRRKEAFSSGPISRRVERGARGAGRSDPATAKEQGGCYLRLGA